MDKLNYRGKTYSEKDFDKYSIQEFNLVFDANLESDNISFHELCEEVDRADVSYFYMSACHEDVFEAVENEIEVAEQMGLRFIQVCGYYIATY